MTPWRGLALLSLVWLAAMNALAPAGVPDAMITGYDLDHLRAFVTDPDAVARAAGLLFWMDTVFPALLTLVLIWPLRGLWRLPALAYGGFDYAENLVLRHFYLSEGPAPELAPMLSMAKWICVGLALVVLAATLIRQRRLP